MILSADPFSLRGGSLSSPDGNAPIYAGSDGERASVADLLKAATRQIEHAELDPVSEAELRHTLGAALCGNGMYADSIAQLERAIQLWDTAEGALSGHALESYAVLVDAHYYRGDADVALRLCISVLAQPGVNRAAGDRHVLRLAVERARCLETLGRPDEAIAGLLDTLEAAERSSKTDASAFVRAKLELARILGSYDRAADALEISRELVEYCRMNSISGELYVQALERVDRALSALGRVADAEAACRETVRASEQYLGADHPLTAYRYVSLAQVLQASDKFSDAVTWGELGLKRLVEYLGDDHHWTLRAKNILAWTLARANLQLDRARELAEHGTAGYELLYGPDHRFAVNARDTLALILRLQGNLAESEAIYRTNLALTKQSVRGWARAVYMWALADCLIDQGRFVAAETQLLEALHHVEATAPQEIDPRMQGLRRLVLFYEAWHAAHPDEGYDAKAAEWRAKLQAWQATTQPAAMPSMSGVIR